MSKEIEILDDIIEYIKEQKEDLQYETKESAIKFELRGHLLNLIEAISGTNHYHDNLLNRLAELERIICGAYYTGYGENQEYDRHPTSDKRKSKKICKEIAILIKMGEEE